MRAIIDFHIEQVGNSYDPPTKEDVEIGIRRLLQGYDNVIKGHIVIDNVVDIIEEDVDKE